MINRKGMETFYRIVGVHIGGFFFQGLLGFVAIGTEVWGFEFAWRIAVIKSFADGGFTSGCSWAVSSGTVFDYHTLHTYKYIYIYICIYVCTHMYVNTTRCSLLSSDLRVGARLRFYKQELDTGTLAPKNRAR